MRFAHVSNPRILFLIVDERRRIDLSGFFYEQKRLPSRHLDQPERTGVAGLRPHSSAAGALAARADPGIDRPGRRRYCAGFGNGRSEYDVRDHTVTPGRFTSLTSILRVRLSGSGFVDEYPST